VLFLSDQSNNLTKLEYDLPPIAPGCCFFFCARSTHPHLGRMNTPPKMALTPLFPLSRSELEQDPFLLLPFHAWRRNHAYPPAYRIPPVRESPGNPIALRKFFPDIEWPPPFGVDHAVSRISQLGQVLAGPQFVVNFVAPPAKAAAANYLKGVSRLGDLPPACGGRMGKPRRRWNSLSKSAPLRSLSGG